MMQSGDNDDLCPICREDDRSLFRLASGRVVLCCEECSSTWLDLRNTGWDGPSSDEKLRELLGDNIDTEFEHMVRIHDI